MKDAAKRRLAQQKAERELAKRLEDVEIEPIDDPLAAFAAIVEEAVALKNYCADRVAELERLRYESSQGGTEQLRAEVQLYERAMDRAGRMLADWVRFGFDERRVALTERQAEVMANVLGAVTATVFDLVRAELAKGSLDASWLGHAQRELVPKIMRKQLELVVTT